MQKEQYLQGLVFQRLKVLGRSRARKGKNSYWDCLCKCGNKTVVRADHLKIGCSTSCGCFRKEITAVYTSRHRETSGGKTTKEYRTWTAILHRTTSQNSPSYPSYGGRGIIVCQKWRTSFRNFLKDMGRAPSPQHSIDRIDNEGNYCKANCRWATRIEQANNRRTTIFINVGGERMALANAARKTGINYSVLAYQYRKGRTSFNLLLAKK